MKFASWRRDTAKDKKSRNVSSMIWFSTQYQITFEEMIFIALCVTLPICHLREYNRVHKFHSPIPFYFGSIVTEDIQPLLLMQCSPSDCSHYASWLRRSTSFRCLRQTSWTVVPSPSILANSTCTWWICATCFTMASPKPVPPVAREWLLSTR